MEGLPRTPRLGGFWGQLWWFLFFCFALQIFFPGFLLGFYFCLPSALWFFLEDALFFLIFSPSFLITFLFLSK